MPWKPLPSVAFAICTYPFQASEPRHLPLQVGDHIYIIEQGGDTDDWYRGYLVAPPSLLAGLTSDRGQQLEHRVFSGIFPANCLEVREYLGEGQHDLLENGAEEDEEYEQDPEPPTKRQSKSQAFARRASRRTSRKSKTKSIVKKPRPTAVPHREPDAPKPLAPVPLLRVGDETGLSAAEPLVDEIASCLREWHDARLHEMLLARGYSQLARVQDLIRKVDNSRNQLMHDVLTRRELAELREDTVWDLVAGNKMMSDEVIVRSPVEKGRLLTADDSVIEMTKLQANMSILDRPPKPVLEKHTLHHLFVDVRTLVCDSDQPATLHMFLCSKNYAEKPTPLSENYAINVPIPATPSQTPEDQSKTLYVNLSNTDVGIGADMRSLYVVFKLLRDEPVRRTVHGQGMTHSQKPSLLHNATGLEKGAGAKGRRSVFGSQRKKDTHSRNTSEAVSRPETAHSQRSDMDGRSSSTASDAPVTSELKTVRRVVGMGALDITRVAQSKAEFERTISLWTPSSAADDRSDESEDWAEIIRELQVSQSGGFARVGLIKRLDVFVKAFATADLDGLIRERPMLLHDCLMTPKLGFLGVPSEQRSDIYLTLSEPKLLRNATLAHSKFGAVPLQQRCQTSLANLQLTLEVRKGNGERIDDCIFTAANHQAHTAWRTVAIERGEAWNQTIRLAIPAEEVPGSHVVMSIADSPNFPFALAWVPLWEFEAFVRDGDKQVVLYVYDEYSSSIIGGKGAYLALPPWHDKSDPAQQNAALVSLGTFLCSTEYSQDPTLLGVLHWRKYHGEQLIELLERFPFVPELEIVKLLKEVFSALFEILHEYESQEEYEDVVFYNFVVVLSIARDKRFELGSIIEDYAITRHDWPSASRCLVRAYQRLVSSPLDPDASRKLRATFKVSEQMLKLIVETTRELSTTNGATEDDEEEEAVLDPRSELKAELHKLFVAVMALLRNPMPVLLGTQTLLIQHFHSWLPELEPMMTPQEILEIATDLMDSCAHARGRMILYRLILVINYSHLDVFRTPETWSTLVENTFRWLAPYWGNVGEATEQWRDQVRLCCSVVAAQMEHLGEEGGQYVPKLTESFAVLQREPRHPKRVFSMLFPTTFPFPTRQTAQSIDVDEAMLEISALLAAALASGRKLCLGPNQVDVPEVILDSLKVGQSILCCEAFPRSWLSLLVSHHRHGMTALERISDSLIESLPDFSSDASEAFEFDTTLWRAFFNTLFAALGSPALAMETFPEQKRRAVWKIAGDVRELGANLLRRSWEAIGWDTDEETHRLHGFQKMGGYQVQFVPDFIAPIVELCLSVHASLRAVAIEVLRSMIIGAWQIDQDLSIIQGAMVDCLDKLCRTKTITESLLQKTFVPEMLEQFRSLQRTIEDSLYIAVQDMFGKIDDLLVMLANVHQGGAISDASRLVETLNLMQFLKDVQSEEAHTRYVHQLAEMQNSQGNITEAGMALQMHADRLDWDPVTILPAMRDTQMPSQTAFERKEQLYFRICQHYEKGRSWKRALVAYRELAVQYELNVFDFSKLARAQRAIASIQERIAKGDRTNPRYFRVVYRGLGFPPTLRDKQFIFEGHQSDRFAVFEDRMQQLHPSAKILRRVGELPEVEGQFLQIFAVSPNKDIEHMVYQRIKVSQAVREYNLTSNPRRFATTSRQPAQDVPITEQVVEKVVYTTAEEFPTILRRSEIVHVETVTLLPVEAAIERTTRKTQGLLALEKRIASGEDEGAITRLTEDLMSSVDPQSDSSVSRYRSLLPASEMADNTSGEFDLSVYGKEQALDSTQNALKVALLDHALAIRRCLALYKKPDLLPTRAELIPRFEASFAHEIATLWPQKTIVDDNITPRSSIEQITRIPAGQLAATAGAANQEDSQMEADRSRPQRRMSLNFLRRRSSVSRSGREEGGGVKPESRGGSRTRDRSLSRLSFFRNHSDQQEAGRNSVGGGLRRRLSFLGNGNGNGNVEQQEDGTGGGRLVDGGFGYKSVV
ncbi:Dedicator of cytokinesis 3 [Lecanosticta acicola]|uniref:Dedicator of cytokinesis 3 n=1 Tax=Lecanosticta acicola TaxID=111012 RepID=A0AAI8YXN0_9PEZI|nr:Dedicator of cytokinesis 3 [Lecanosticta acicola]